MRDIRMYILVNQDIEMNKSELAIQVGHVAEKMLFNQFRITGKLLPAVIQYMNSGQRKTLLYCPQSKLEELEKQGYVTVRSKINSEPLYNTLTCLNVGLSYVGQELTEDINFIKDLKFL